MIAPAGEHNHKVAGIDEPIPVLNTALNLAGAIQRNSHLKIMVIAGLYDLATLFAGAEFDVEHPYLTSNLRQNIRDYFLVEDEAEERCWAFRQGDGMDEATGVQD